MSGLILFGITSYDKVEPFIRNNGRLGLWKQVIKDIQSPPIHQDINGPGLTQAQKRYLAYQNDRNYPMTGLGLGSFKIMYPEKHKKRVIYQYKFVRFHYPGWGNPHNAYIHIAYSLGVIGLGLFLIIIWTTLYPASLEIKYNKNLIPIFVSVISVLILSLATFILEIEPTRIYSAILVGLLLNKELPKFHHSQSH